MASAKKCDRCGSYYEIDDNKNPITLFAERTIKTLVNSDADHMADRMMEMTLAMIDLCPECAKELRDWFKAGKEAAEQ